MSLETLPTDQPWLQSFRVQRCQASRGSTAQDSGFTAETLQRADQPCRLVQEQDMMGQDMRWLAREQADRIG